MQSRGKWITLLCYSRNTSCRLLHTTSCLESRRSSKLERIERSRLLKENRSNPDLEKLARTKELLVPLEQVAEEYRSKGQYFTHLKTVGVQFGIFRDVFGQSFYPKTFTTIRYGSKQVYQGNLLKASETSHQPQVKLPMPDGGDDKLWTLIMTNPDGNLQDQTTELLHWMVTNIKGTSVLGGREECPYLPPIPPQGSGYHRYVFAVYSHVEPLPLDLLPSSGTWLERRKFSTSDFLTNYDNLVPSGFNVFQATWDDSVGHVYRHILKYPEPVYKVEKPPTAHQIKQDALRRKHNNFYRYMLL